MRLFSTLVEGFKIDTNNIIVLSQYKAQVEYIRKELTKDNRFGPSDSIHVNTVVASQGMLAFRNVLCRGLVMFSVSLLVGIQCYLARFFLFIYHCEHNST